MFLVDQVLELEFDVYIRAEPDEGDAVLVLDVLLDHFEQRPEPEQFPAAVLHRFREVHDEN